LIVSGELLGLLLPSKKGNVPKREERTEPRVGEMRRQTTEPTTRLMPVRLRFHDRAKFRRVFDASLKRDSNWMGLPIGLVLDRARKKGYFRFVPARDVSRYRFNRHY